MTKFSFLGELLRHSFHWLVRRVTLTTDAPL